MTSIQFGDIILTAFDAKINERRQMLILSFLYHLTTCTRKNLQKETDGDRDTMEMIEDYEDLRVFHKLYGNANCGIFVFTL